MKNSTAALFTGHHAPLAPLSWSTASFAAPAMISAIEQSALREHLTACCALSGRLFALRCRADGLRDFIATRFVTTLVITGLTLGLFALLF